MEQPWPFNSPAAAHREFYPSRKHLQRRHIVSQAEQKEEEGGEHANGMSRGGSNSPSEQFSSSLCAYYNRNADMNKK